MGALAAAALATLWAIFLNGGTLGLNSAIDRDTDAVGYLQRPPPPHLAQTPACLAQTPACLAWMVAGGIATSLLCPAVALPYGACFVLSLAYSVPPLRLKARPGWDLAVNMAGYGALTFLAGGLAGDARDPLAWGALAGGFAALLAALYRLTQRYQLEQDRAAGVRNLALALGRCRTWIWPSPGGWRPTSCWWRGCGGSGCAAPAWVPCRARGGLDDPARHLAGGPGCATRSGRLYWGTRLYGLADVALVAAGLVGPMAAGEAASRAVAGRASGRGGCKIRQSSGTSARPAAMRRAVQVSRIVDVPIRKHPTDGLRPSPRHDLPCAGQRGLS